MASDSLVTVSTLAKNNEKIKEQLATKVDKTELENYYTSDEVDEIVENLYTGDVDLTGYATETFVTDKIAEIEIPSLDGYAKTEDIPDEYDDTEIKQSITDLGTDIKANEDAIATLNGTGEGSVSKTVDDALNKFATDLSDDGVVNTYKELVDYAAEHSSDVVEMVADIENNTTAIEELDTKVSDIESDLGGHTVKSDVPENAKFTDTVYEHPTSGATAGTYKSVTVDANGHVTGGSNPTTTIAEGGTGATTAKGAQYNLLNDMQEVTTDVSDTSELVGSYVSDASVNNGILYKRKALTIWNYIKSKISSVLGLTETNYNGNAVSATKATQDGDGNVIASTYATTDHEHDEIVGNSLSIETTMPTSIGDGTVMLGAGMGSSVTKYSSSHTTSLIGGRTNTINVNGMSGGAIIDGESNEITGYVQDSVIVGGYDNTLKTTSSQYVRRSSIMGGYKNTISANNVESICNTVLGGESNTLASCAKKSAIIAGTSNNFTDDTTSKENSVIVGGNGNTVSAAKQSVIIGGTSNKISTTSGNNVVVGGSSNEIDILANNGTIVGGTNNKMTSSASGSTINGGYKNTIHSHYATILGGQNNTISTAGNGSVISGYSNNANNQWAFVIGNGNTANAQYTFMSGTGLITSCPNSAIFGQYNKDSTSNYMIVGNGTSSSAQSNAMRLTTSGYLYYNTGCGAGADYAEFFEWADGNPDSEDRCGLFVTFDFDKEYDYKTAQELPMLKIANDGDYILGVISGNPSFLGNADEDWKKRFLYDEFDRPILEEYLVPITEFQEVETGEYRTEIEYDENDEEVEVQIPITEIREVETGEYRTEIRNVLNPDYDYTQEYESRSSRKEWDATGLLGVLSVRDDGTCEAGKFCKCGANGIATLAAERGIDTYLVLRRISDNVIKIVFK